MTDPDTYTTKQLQRHKEDVRAQVWERLRKVAYPDSRFHWDFAEFIADFKGSDHATDMILSHPFYKRAINTSNIDENGTQRLNLVFITPDNCLELLRFEMLQQGLPYLMTTYGIYRGFYIVDPAKIPVDQYQYASTLDGMEKLSQHVTLKELQQLNVYVPLMITGTGAINDKGIRFGKGHGYFDLEWAILSTIGCVDVEKTDTVAVVHDVQLLTGIELNPEVFDTVCDYVVTNSKVLEIKDSLKPTCGVIWDMLAPGMLEDIEPLKELYDIVHA